MSLLLYSFIYIYFTRYCLLFFLMSCSSVYDQFGVFRTNSYVVFTHNVKLFVTLFVDTTVMLHLRTVTDNLSDLIVLQIWLIDIYIYIYASNCKWIWNCEGERRLFTLVIPWQLPVSKIVPFFHTYIVCHDDFSYTLSSVLKFDHYVLSGQEDTKQILIIRTRFLKKYRLWGTNEKLY